MTTRMTFTVYVAGDGMAAGVQRRLQELCAEREVSVEVNVVDVAADPKRRKN